MDESVIFSQCVFDADNRYADLTLRPTSDNSIFILIMSDISGDEEYDCEIKLHLTRVELRTVIDRLTNILEKNNA